MSAMKAKLTIAKKIKKVMSIEMSKHIITEVRFR